MDFRRKREDDDVSDNYCLITRINQIFLQCLLCIEYWINELTVIGYSCSPQEWVVSCVGFFVGHPQEKKNTNKTPHFAQFSNKVAHMVC